MSDKDRVSMESLLRRAGRPPDGEKDDFGDDWVRRELVRRRERGLGRVFGHLKGKGESDEEK